VSTFNIADVITDFALGTAAGLTNDEPMRRDLSGVYGQLLSPYCSPERI